MTSSEEGKTPKSGGARKPSGSSSKPRSSGSSGSTSRRKRKSEPDAIGLDDILKALIK